MTAPGRIAPNRMEFPMSRLVSRLVTASALALSLVGGLSSTASAQSYNAPAGIPAVTAPGGLEGTAAAGNLQRYEQRLGRATVGPIRIDRVETTGSIRRAR
ncbi:hypothetical protein JCM2811A_24620 [Methylorubrum rhodinum]